uniref:Uncharacterized protein n=1 Tax=Magallana gigas TaxID=29159 RepID=A0A8W8NP78_MAGGI
MNTVCILIVLCLCVANGDESCDRKEMEDTICSLCSQRKGNQSGHRIAFFHTCRKMSQLIPSPNIRHLSMIALKLITEKHMTQDLANLQLLKAGFMCFIQALLHLTNLTA